MPIARNSAWLWAGLLLAVLVIAALGTYSWTLKSELAALQRDTAQDAPSAVHPWPQDWNPWSDDWDPSGQFEQMRRRMEQMMGVMQPGSSLFNNQGFGLLEQGPQIERSESSEAYRIVISVPPRRELELETELQDSRLHIAGKIRLKSEQQRPGANREFISTSVFSQTLMLAEPVEAAAMTVERERDHIVITIPKRRP